MVCSKDTSLIKMKKPSALAEHTTRSLNQVRLTIRAQIIELIRQTTTNVPLDHGFPLATRPGRNNNNKSDNEHSKPHSSGMLSLYTRMSSCVENTKVKP